MNKTAIKNYAVWARNELIERVTRKAYEYGVKNDDIANDNCAEMINGRLLTEEEKAQRKQLIDEINKKGFDQVIEEVSYTWFNRFIALRFMEVNNYIPQKVRVFTNSENEFKPQLLDEAVTLDLEGVDKEKVFELIDTNQRDELYKMLLLAICNDMGNYLPGMFTTISDYTMLLFPDNLLKEDSVLGKLISDIEADNFDIEKEGQVEIIGWFYQFYNIEPKLDVFSKPKGKKITKNEIPAATQLFTPDWVVRYMVENSLGRFWIEGHPNEELKENWKYYLDEADQEPEVERKLEEIRNQYKSYKPEDIKLIDPCMGSGHILIYAFDVLMQIYESYGYTKRDAAQLIIENNLYGIDLDERAYQLSYFAIMMKARQYSRRILSKDIKPNVYYVASSKEVHESIWDYFGEQKEVAMKLWQSFENASELGSLLELDITLEELNSLEDKLEEINNLSNTSDLLIQSHITEAYATIYPLTKLAKVLTNKYEVVVTNPPYLPVSKCTTILEDFIKSRYPKSKTDLFAVFIERCKKLLAINGLQAMITMHSWMFLTSYKELREEILNNSTIINMVYLGAATFEELNSFNVLVTSFIIRNSKTNNYVSHYNYLAKIYNSDDKEKSFNDSRLHYYLSQETILEIPGAPIVFWISNSAINNFILNNRLAESCSPKVGLQTGNNNRFVRNWFESNINDICFDASNYEEAIESNCKWFPYNKGGNFRKWYGMNEYIVNWENDGMEIKNFKDEKGKIRSRPQNTQFYFKPGITWSLFGFENFAVRYKKNGFIFDVSGASIFPNKDDVYYYLAFLCSKVAFLYLSVLAPTVNFQVGNIADLPFKIDYSIKEEVETLAKECVDLANEDWNNFEYSWEFKKHPFIEFKQTTLAKTFDKWKDYTNLRYDKLKRNEENINQLFISSYNLEKDITPEVIDRDIAMHKADVSKDVKSFISYAVGCMLGRYSLDQEGLAYAGGQWEADKYKTFAPDADNIIPICDDEYFSDDIVARFAEFVKIVYGEETLEENLQFIADALGGKGTAREVIRNYFLNDFYKDHCKTYQKRPIYWMFDSGKKNGFKAIMYLHRYKADTVARLRTKYVFDQQTIYEDQINMLNNYLNDGVSQREKTSINKELKKFTAQADELRAYEETVHHFADQMVEIDLDDGVKVNYEKFDGLLAKIK